VLPGRHPWRTLTIVTLVLAAGRPAASETLDECPPSGSAGVRARARAALVDARSTTEELVDLGELLIRQGAGASSEALELAEAALHGATPPLPAARRLHARVLMEAGRAPEALVVLQALVAARNAGDLKLDGLDEDLAECQLALQLTSAADTTLASVDAPPSAHRLELAALVARQRGNYEDARSKALEALRLRQATAPGDPDQVRTLTALGALAWFAGNYDEDRRWHLQAVEQACRSLGSDHPWLATSLSGLSVAEYELGDMEPARRHLEQAVRIAQNARGAGHPETLALLHNLANLQLNEGDYAGAMARYDEVLAAQRALPGDHSESIAHVRFNQGELLRLIGDPDAAEEAYRSALALWESQHGARHPFVARAAEALAETLASQSRDTEAVALFERAAEIWAASPGTGALDAAFALTRAGRCYVRLGQRETAQARATRVAALLEDQVADLRTARRTADLGELLLDLDDPQAASAAFLRAESKLSAVLGDDHPQVALARTGQARALLALGSIDAAVAAAGRAEDAWRRHVLATARYLAEGQAVRLAANLPLSRDLLLSAALARPQGPPVLAAFTAVARGRALLIDEMAQRRHAERNVMTPDAQAARTELQQQAGRLVQLLRREDASQARVAAIAEAKSALERAERRLLMLDAGARRGTTLLNDIGELQRALPERAALVSFVRFQDLRSGTAKGARYAAWISRARGTPRFVDLGPATVIESAVHAWRVEIEDVAAALQSAAAGEAAARQAGERLRQVLWDPLSTELRGARLALLVPDGAVNLVNLAALPAARGGYLVEGALRFHQLSTERELLAPGAIASSPGRLLAIGGPDYDAGDTAVTETASVRGGAPCPTGREAFRFLPAAGRETVEIAERWAGVTHAPTDVRIGLHADEAAFRTLAPGHSVIHLATHGFFTDRSCLASAVAASLDPLLSSGLALAGANRSSATTADDGLLTSAEIASLDLSATRWAVLSACGSGLGRLEDGEGMLGLRRAFVVAGVSTVVTSLGDVDDGLARRFMRELYAARFERRLSTVAALRSAQLALLRQLRAEGPSTHPALWGAFVASGDWR
jgi:CHAT domain-containing protein